MPNENTLPTPENRREMFLAAAAGESVEKPEPITREEMFLNAIGGTGDAYTKAQTDELLDGKADLENGKVPASQLPSYVDDVAEYASTAAFPATGENGKIYISTDTNKTYRWGGSAYVEISESLALGETASTAYPGNKGKANADAIGTIANLTTTATDLVGAVNELNSGKVNVNGTDSLMTAAEHTKLAGIASGAEVNVQADWNQTDTTADDYIKNKPAIPEVQVNSDWDAVSGVAQILNKPTIPDAQIQSDWNQNDTESKDFIKNKPTLGTASAKDYTTAVSGLSTDLITSAGVSEALSDKVDKVTGKGLSTNDFTNSYKETLDGLSSTLNLKADLVDGKVPAAQMPSYVDDVLEYNSTSAFPADGESGKIYVAKDTNRTYRWSGSDYVEISESLALGETSSTAYPGNKGKANADAIAAIKDGTNIDSFADVETALAAKLNTADVDDALSSTSMNPVQNKAIQAPLARLVDAGAKNLLKITATSQTINGVTFSVNDDGTITANGTANNRVVLFVNTDVPASILRSGKFTGCPANGSEYSYNMILEQNSFPYSAIAYDYGSGKILSYTENINANCYIQIKSGITVNDLVFKPMICTNEDYIISQGFVPHAMSNLELTKVVNRFGVKLINVELAERTFTKSNSGLYYSDSVDLSGSFSEIYAATMQKFNYVRNISIQPMIASNTSLALAVCDPSSPSTLTFTNGEVKFVIFGILK